MMSYITLHSDGWQQHSYIALMGVSGKALMHCLNEREDILTVVFCLDNDEAGKKAIERLTAEIQSLERRYQIEIDQSVAKDWNEDLQQMCERTIQSQELTL